MIKVEILSVTPDAERLIENAGRTSYLSFKRQIKGSEKEFIKMLIKSGHLSVLEHAYATFRIKGGSRAFTHQLVRHRLCSYTQQSQRYVNESNYHYIEPESIRKNQQTHKMFLDFLTRAKRTYSGLQKLGIKNEDARFVLPNAVESEIVITANFREWRHIIELRGSPDAQWEIRKIVIEIYKVLKKYAPSVFGDFVIEKENKTILKKKMLD
jgi:thymidylate synthase (FAD)